MKKMLLVSLSIIAAALVGCMPPQSIPPDDYSASNTTISPTIITSEPTLQPTPTSITTPVPTPTQTPIITPTPTPTVLPTPTPEPTPEPTPAPEPTSVISPYSGNYGSPYTENGTLSNKSHGWYYNRNKDYQPPTAQRDFDISQFDGYYLGDINNKVVYLTFDAGYENGYTATILDVLKEKNVLAAFFLPKTYIKSNIELVNRMVNEGHVIANHSVSHPSFPTLTDDEVEYEIMETDRYFLEVTGVEMDKFFRPPSGEYSARTLEITQRLGYKSIFWSWHYLDYDVNNQPGKDHAYQRVVDYTHSGCIYLLHAVSSSNTEALPDIIDYLRNEGYAFKSLYDLP